MQAERLILETDKSGNLMNMPKLPANKKLEVIFLMIGDTTEAAAKRRFPNPDIAGKIKITGDIINAVPDSEWDLP